MSPGDPRRAFPTSIVESHAEEQFLPYHMGIGGADPLHQSILPRLTEGATDAHILCEIESDLSAADETKFKEKNRRFWSLGKHHFKVDYEVKVLIGAADVRFELCEAPSLFFEPLNSTELPADCEKGSTA